MFRPRPPDSSGSAYPNRPMSAAARRRSSGIRSVSSSSSARGTTFSRTKERTASSTSAKSWASMRASPGMTESDSRNCSAAIGQVLRGTMPDMELTQVRLIVSDFAGCFRFYRDVLGLRPQFDDDSGPYAKFSPDEGGAAIALHDRADLARSLPGLAAAAGDRALVVLKVADVDAYAASAAERGATLLGEPAGMW